MGVGRRKTHYPIPGEVRKKVRRVFRLSDLRNCNYVADAAPDGKATVAPWWITVVDCGSALEGPPKKR